MTAKAKTDYLLMKERNLFQRMNDVMRALDGKIEKDGAVTYGNKYKYVSIAGLTNEIRRALVENGLAFFADLVIEDRSGKSLIQTYKCTLVNADSPEDKIEMLMCGTANDQSPTASGICLSYAVKNCFLKTFCLAGDDDDAEAHANPATPVQSFAKKKPSPLAPVSKVGPKTKPPKKIKCTVISVEDTENDSVKKIKIQTVGTSADMPEMAETVTNKDTVIAMARTICEAEAECMIVTRKTERGNIELVSIEEIS